MARADFCFHAELNHFLPANKKQVNFLYYFKERASIKDTIESLGVPHPEVEVILVNKNAVNFSYIIQDGDNIQVYPVSASQEILTTISLRPQLPTIPRFVLDVHLGKLAASVRMLGFDTLYRNDYDDEELAQISASEERILLTRDKGLLMRSLVTFGYYVRATNPEQQIVEVLRRYNLFNKIIPFQRCIRCNGLLEPVAKASIIDQIPQKIQASIDEFHRCRECNQIYWRGSHYEKMQKFIQEILSAKDNSA